MPDTTEETLVLVKPDGVARSLTGEILRRIEAKGYSLVDIRLVEADRALLAGHYAEHEGKPFYEPLIEFMESGPIVAIRRPRHRARSGATSAATGGSPCSRTWCTAATRPSPPPASSPSGSTEPGRVRVPPGARRHRGRAATSWTARVVAERPGSASAMGARAEGSRVRCGAARRAAPARRPRSRGRRSG